MSRYYTPIDVDGFARFVQGATAAGWYQLDLPGRVLTLLPGVTVPANSTTGLLIQANTALDFAYSPSVALGGAAFAFTIPAQSTMFIPGYQAVQQFSIKLPASGADFTLQFYSGGIGPVPQTF